MNQTATCTACGTMYPAGTDPTCCVICEDDRQFVPSDGQTWTTRKELARTHAVRVNRLHEQFYELEITPRFAARCRTCSASAARSSGLRVEYSAVIVSVSGDYSADFRPSADTRCSILDPLTRTDTRYQIPDTRFQIPDSRYQIPDTRFQIPDTGYQIDPLIP